MPRGPGQDPPPPSSGRAPTDPADFPAEKTIYAMRDLDRLQGLAAAHGPAIGAYARVILDDPLPWRKMRQVYALLGLVKKWGAERVEAACSKAADAEAFNVGLIGRMLERATEGKDIEAPPRQLSLPGRFARPVEQFAVRRPERQLPPRRPRSGLRSQRRGRFSPSQPRAPRRSPMTAPAPVITAELKAVLRQVKLGRCLDTLPERLALAKSADMAYADFLELVLSDEVTRRETTSASLRARAAGLDPDMCLENWDPATKVNFDHQIWDELCSLRFIDAGHNALVLGPVGVGKTFMATALGHAAVRRR